LHHEQVVQHSRPFQLKLLLTLRRGALGINPGLLGLSTLPLGYFRRAANRE
jgi:hypothetical protein